jgi:hypothetical protein
VTKRLRTENDAPLPANSTIEFMIPEVIDYEVAALVKFKSL